MSTQKLKWCVSVTQVLTGKTSIGNWLIIGVFASLDIGLFFNMIMGRKCEEANRVKTFIADSKLHFHSYADSCLLYHQSQYSVSHRFNPAKVRPCCWAGQVRWCRRLLLVDNQTSDITITHHHQQRRSLRCCRWNSVTTQFFHSVDGGRI